MTSISKQLRYKIQSIQQIQPTSFLLSFMLYPSKNTHNALVQPSIYPLTYTDTHIHINTKIFSPYYVTIRFSTIQPCRPLLSYDVNQYKHNTGLYGVNKFLHHCRTLTFTHTHARARANIHTHTRTYILYLCHDETYFHFIIECFRSLFQRSVSLSSSVIQLLH